MCLRELKTLFFERNQVETKWQLLFERTHFQTNGTIKKNYKNVPSNVFNDSFFYETFFV